MRFFLKSLRRVVSRRSTGRFPNARRLSFEQLGVRQMLAADAGESIEAADDPASVPAETAPLASHSAADSPLWGAANAKLAGEKGMPTSSESYGGYGGYGFIPPEISGFTCYQLSSGAWSFVGTVTDDESVTGLYVHFGGVLEGESTTVGPDGSFEFTIYLPPNTLGVVTAVVTDWDGIQSEQAQTLVG
jgi:hypothetical protein